MIQKCLKQKNKLILAYSAYKRKKKKKTTTKEVLKQCEKALEMKCYINITSQL